jgi:hypothetical protein
VARHRGPIDVERIFLYEENPRHEPIESEPEIIEYLCRDEQVYNLARSISESGTNPLDLLGLIEISGSGKKKSYQCWEGNRRVCAIKLLNDPDRAPAHLRNDFTKLSTESAHVPIEEIECVVFDDRNDLKFWMGIIHDGAQAGVGRKSWGAEQKARHFGVANRNRLAHAVLAAAEEMGLITKEERAGTITTVQRFLNRDIVKEALGIDSSNLDDVTFNRPLEDFKKLLGLFFADLKEGERVNSRKNRDQVDAYGRVLARTRGISGKRVQPQSLKTAAAAAASKAPEKPKRRTKPREPRKLAYLAYDKDLGAALEESRSNKLDALYFAITSVHVQHAPLLTVGVWAFVESLCAFCGKNEDTDFLAYYSNQKFSELDFKDKDRTTVREALTHIQRNGNSTKHHEIAAGFDAAQLANDLETITPLLTKTLESRPPKK